MNILVTGLLLIIVAIGMYFFVWSGIVTYRFATRSHQNQSISRLDLRNTILRLTRRTLILSSIALIASTPLWISDSEFPPLLMLITCMIVPLLSILAWFAAQLFNLRFAYKYKIVEENDSDTEQV
jgi:hypothetical protein